MQHVEYIQLPHYHDLKLQAPRFATEKAAGLDLHACISQPLCLAPGDCQLVPSGIALFIRDANYCGLIYPRSGLGHKHGIVLGNGVGVIDADYQGEILISCYNRSPSTYTLEPGIRLAQLIFQPIARPVLQPVITFSESTIRGSGGFGSTGTHSRTDQTIVQE